MTQRDKNLEALESITRSFEHSEYNARKGLMFDTTRKHGDFRDVHLAARARMTGPWPGECVETLK